MGHIWVVDGATRQVRAGSNNYALPKQIVALGGGAYRLMTRSPRHDTVAVGDLVKLPQRLNLKCPHAFRVEGSKDVTLQNVTIESAPCFGFVSTWGDGIVLDHVRVIPGPPPPGATEPRTFSSSADGLNLENDEHGAIIHDCRVESNGDDGIAIYDSPDLIVGPAGGASVLIGLNEFNTVDKPYPVGDTLRFFLPTGPVDRKIASVERQPTPADLAQIRQKAFAGGAAKRGFERTLRVGLDLPVTAEPGDHVLDLRYAGGGFDISRNVLVNNASRGINVNQSFGTVSHNSITHSFLPGIHMTEFMATGGSPFQTSVQIIDNVITDACIGDPGRKDWQGAISIVSWEANHYVGGHTDITITGNTIDRPNGIGIQVQTGSRIVVADNVFGPVGVVRKGATPPAVLLDNVLGATVRGNVIKGDGWGAAGAQLRIMPNCRDISAEMPFAPPGG